MANNIIDLVRNQLGADFASNAASAAGVKPEQAKTAISAGIPAILASILGAGSTASGKTALGSALQSHGPELLTDLPSMLKGGRQESLINSGISTLTSLLGENKLSSLVGSLGNFSGVGGSSGRSLLGLLTPLVMGVLGREGRGGVDGVMNLLRAQAPNIKNALPPSLATSLQSSGLLDGVDEVPAAGRKAAGYAAAGTSAAARETAHGAREVAGRTRNRGRYWTAAAIVAALAVIIWGATRDRSREPQQQAQTAAEPQPRDTTAAPDQRAPRVAAVDAGDELGRITDGFSETLKSVTDGPTAQAAMPRLTQLGADLDRVVPLVDGLPDSAKPAFRQLAGGLVDGLQPEIDRVSSLSGVPAPVKQAITDLDSKLHAVAQR